MSIDKLKNIWSDWIIEKELGKGAYGTVYQAVRNDSGISRRAAIKVISLPRDSSEVVSLNEEDLTASMTQTLFKGIVDDFINEIKAMESLKGCPNIVCIDEYKVVEHEDGNGWDIYICMELLTPLNSYLSDRKMTEQDVAKLGYDICSALEVCSKHSIIHRDIKPENIFVDDSGDYKLGDFGIACSLENHTNGFLQMGTYNYMAPEVFKGEAYDARADIYSLGIVLYRLLNENRLPFLEDANQQMDSNMRKAARDRRFNGEMLSPPCQASPNMAALIMLACSYDPKKRFSNAGAMKNAFANLAGMNNQAVMASQKKEPKKKVQKASSGMKLQKWLMLLLVILSLGGISASAMVIYPDVAFVYTFISDLSGNEKFGSKDISSTTIPKSTAVPLTSVPTSDNPTKTPTPRPTNTLTPRPTKTPTPRPTNTPTPRPTSMPTPRPSNTPTPTPTPASTPTPMPTKTPTPKPTKTSTPKPTKTPTPKPTKTPTPKPTNTPTPKPTKTPTPKPTKTPTPMPSLTLSSQDAHSIIKTYQGTYTSKDFRHFKLNIISCDQDGTVAAVFNYYDGNDSTKILGSFQMEGTVKRKLSDNSLVVDLKGINWTEKTDSNIIDFEITISPDRTKIRSEDYELYGMYSNTSLCYASYDIVKNYSGSYVGDWGKTFAENFTGLSLYILSCDPSSGAVEALFAFYKPIETSLAQTGQFTMKGNIVYEYPDGTIKLNLEGDEWLDRPSNTSMLDFSLYISSDGKKVYSDKYQIDLVQQ